MSLDTRADDGGHTRPRPLGRTLMVQGTASHVGKSLLVTALCRVFRRAGLRVAPFKSQNMANNAFIDASGGEMGRAQVVQAMAAGVAPHTDMNPILLKPEGDFRSQVIVEGRVWGRMGFREYRTHRPELLGVVASALGRLRATHDVVVIEGAGSPAEINLRAGELVNMSVAMIADAPVILAGDIDRGGVFAHLVGTLALLTPDERARVKAVVINKFRGDVSLLRPGLDWFTEYSGVPVAGVMPYLRDLRIPDEDSLAVDAAVDQSVRIGNLDTVTDELGHGLGVDVVAIALPHVANSDDLDPLRREPGVQVRWVDRPEHVGTPNLIVIPGTKTTQAALNWLRMSGLDRAIIARAHAGTAVIGLCGGYQILGEVVIDVDGVEATAGTSTPGLGLLPVRTTFAAEKATCRVRAVVADTRGILAGAGRSDVVGYEIHLGRTTGEHQSSAFTIGAREGRAPTDLDSAGDGLLDATGRILGTYLHGLFENDALRRSILAAVAPDVDPSISDRWGSSRGLEAELDRLADIAEASLDIAAIADLSGIQMPS